MFNRSLFDRCVSTHLAATTLSPRQRATHAVRDGVMVLAGVAIATSLFLYFT